MTHDVREGLSGCRIGRGMFNNTKRGAPPRGRAFTREELHAQRERIGRPYILPLMALSSEMWFRSRMEPVARWSAARALT